MTDMPYIHKSATGTNARISWPPLQGDQDDFVTVPVLRNGDVVSGLRRYGTSFVSVHEPTKNENAGVSIIPQASVLSDSPRPQVETRELSIGDHVVVDGFGLYQIVKGTMSNGGNEDWPRLLPCWTRYYVHYDGGPGYQSWTIRDARNEGRAIPVDMLKGAARRILQIVNYRQVSSLSEANVLCAYMNHAHQED